MRRVGELVPGVTTVTPHARYYALHGLVADEIDRLGLDAADGRALLRRSEVVLAAASHQHRPHTLARLSLAHGEQKLAGRLAGPSLDLRAAAEDYAVDNRGFWGPYQASERELGIVGRGARLPAPGPHYDRAAVRAGLGPVLELARQPELRIEDAAAAADQLCVCRGAAQPDGKWLAGLLCGPGAAQERRETVRLLLNVLDRHTVHHVERDVWQALAFSPALSAGNGPSAEWRGLALRNYSVGAWRRLWSWLVEQAREGIHADDWADRFAEALDDTTVGHYVAELPRTTEPDGTPSAVEPELRRRGSEEPPPARAFRTLALGAVRARELTGPVAAAFNGPGHGEHERLHPRWLADRLDDHHARPLRDFARELAAVLLRRAHDVALAKSERRKDGTVRLPSRLQQRDSYLFTKGGSEGSGDVALRLDNLAGVLAGCGVLAYGETGWKPTDLGRELCGRPSA